MTAGPADGWAALPPSLTTARLTLGPWRDDDLVPYSAMVHERDPRARRAPRDGRPTPAELRDQVAAQRTSLVATGIGLDAVRLDTAFIGYCGLVVGQADLEQPELAYEFLRAHHGSGFATEAAAVVVEAAPCTGRTRLWATVRPWNDASFRVLDKVGFHRSGRVTTDAFGESIWCTREL